MKESVVKLTTNLLDSALSRDTEQGLVVFRKALELLGEAGSEAEILSVLEKLNKALVGIEAHGYLTSEEFGWVKELREIEEAGV
ncbi:hypothetical protein [Haloferula sp. A504]|uniref:hypothetical protein n=1 Tax=Haloferula sp. A504 TaxID=3373601 RepID=UPI0031CB7BED|nr:hypothetical protein [Verrucomicrobiaceae bacterium E54]